ncbi:hypothetical protein PFISCL1PPCAC_7500, partial [Pristionchus fissidentatus]
MVSAPLELKCSWMEELPADTESHLLGNGRMLFFKSGADQELFWWNKDGRKWNQADLSTKNPLTCAGSQISFKDSLFFYSSSDDQKSTQFYRATIDEAGKKMTFHMNLKISNENKRFMFAVGQPLFQCLPGFSTHDSEKLVVYGFVVNYMPGAFEIKDEHISEPFSRFFVHRSCLYLLAEASGQEVSSRQIQRKTSHRMVVRITVRNPELVGVLALDKMNDAYILINRTLLVMRGHSIEYQLKLYEGPRFPLQHKMFSSASTPRSITGIYNNHLLVNFHDPDKGKTGRWRTHLAHPEHLK